MRMRLLAALLLGALFLCDRAPAAQHDRGIGPMLGEPTGATLKFWRDQDEAVVFGLGINPFADFSVQASADYVLHIFEFGQQFDVPELALYTGLGGRVNGPDDGNVELGLRIPVGVNWFSDERTELFAELTPVLDVAPDWEIDLNAVVGIRFYGW
jgi:hypothetical protein